MSQSYIHTHTIILKAGQVLPFQARAINFLPISCVSVEDNTLQEFELAFDQDQSNPMAVGLEVRRKEYFTVLTFKNTNDVDVKLKFQISTDDITDRRLIYNPEVPVPITVAGGVEVTASVPIDFNGTQPASDAGSPQVYRETFNVGSGPHNFGPNISSKGFLIHVRTVGRFVTILGNGGSSDNKVIMTISDADGPLKLPFTGNFKVVPDDVSVNALDCSISGLV